MIDSISAIVSQRLLRVLCSRCKTPISTATSATDGQNKESAIIFQPNGCVDCHDTGFKGRLAIAEVLTVDDQVRTCLYRDGWLETPALEKALENNGFQSMQQAGNNALQQGLTSSDELQRVLGVHGLHCTGQLALPKQSEYRL